MVVVIQASHCLLLFIFQYSIFTYSNKCRITANISVIEECINIFLF